ncbi:MAG: methylenetetrahydrofolate--tRNA-(uracil(54)-C(5))-methyltransferase (FADH(2)-oxidizing) TrmFO [Alphaproteobacteria bacterium]|nr:methylenetetrahydrofolate--tRNA-(uracil(54)-C(5))-methyltransferase (FADH(2)-oxidizing) TrmFO [Alphaproteobacteria bacterium]
MAKKVSVIGGGLAGSEAAWQLAKRGIGVDLYDMKPVKFSPAHKNNNFAELVCSNSLRADDYMHNAVGLLHEEMRRADSLILKTADATKVPAGGALAVDRNLFASSVTEALKNNPLIHIISKEITSLDDFKDTIVIVATGPLTSEALAADILKRIKGETLCFYDAIAPVVYTESIDFSKAWYQSRYDKGDKNDYINCPLNKQEYENFVAALLSAEKVQFHDFEKPEYFDGCLPIEVMAERGLETLRFGPMKPVGLTNPHQTDIKPYAVVQLRQDNTSDTLRNIVGFQTKLKHGEQTRIFKMIPGLENAQFARLGGIHKNTFIKSPVLLDEFLRLKTEPNIMFAGQITGCEGYVESASVGLMAGIFASALISGQTPSLPPKTTALGAMLGHLRDAQNIENYQPMNINFGLFEDIAPVLTPNGKKKYLKGTERKEAYATRALKDLENFLTCI